MPTMLVTGATGTVGRALTDELLGAGASVRALARDQDAAELPHNVEVVTGDLADPRSLDDVTTGADGAFLLWPFTSPERADELAVPVVRRLARAGRVVYLSAEASIHAPDRFWGRVERVVEHIAPTWTILRPTGFAGNTRMWADQIRRRDVVSWPFAEARRSLIHERDIAAVAARALLQNGHDGRHYVITGPEAIRQQDQLRAIGDALGRELRWEELDRDAALRLLVEQFGNESFARGALETWAGFVNKPEIVTDEVQVVLGRPALPFARWAADHAQDFR
jgi:uncharacterized protein YbjT (DUF2867 family)